jgi:hypothetical protein
MRIDELMSNTLYSKPGMRYDLDRKQTDSTVLHGNRLPS